MLKNNKITTYLFSMLMLIALAVFCVLPNQKNVTNITTNSIKPNLIAGAYLPDTDESILSWLHNKHNALVNNAYYALTVSDETYNMHVYTFDGDQVWEESKTFGDADDVATASTNAQNMIVVVVNGDLTVASGVNVTTYKGTYGGPKGFFLYVTGKLTNNGTITQNSRGAKAPGQNIYLWKNPGGDFELVPKAGAGGGASRNTAGVGNAGKAGNTANKRALGGGGAGGATSTRPTGAGATATSYSGGSGGGATRGTGNGASGGAGNGGAGGYAGSSSTSYIAGGGAGNPGGNGAAGGSNNRAANKGADGTGGLLMIYSDSYENKGTISANGANGGGGGQAGGGGSGGGSVNIFTNQVTRINKTGTIMEQRYYELKGTTATNGGSGGSGTSYAGGAGGVGTTNIGEIRNGQYYDLKEIINQDITSYVASVTIPGDSIMSILKSYDLESGYYNFQVNGQNYPIHLYRYKESQIWDSNKTFGDADDISFNTTATQNTTTYRTYARNMIVVVVDGDLTVNADVTVTTYKTNLGGPKGFFLYVTGKLTNNGTITQNSRGAYATGQNVYLWKNADGSYEQVTAAGGSGGAGRNTTGVGNAGAAGSTVNKRALGGGGGGGAASTQMTGSGSAATSYSGGSGGGGTRGTGNGASNAGGNGGAGGYGGSSNSSYIAGGGAGNPGGNGAAGGSNNTTNGKGTDGTGGLLIIYCDEYSNKGTISSNGTAAGGGQAGGGGSGGGSINIFTNEPTRITFTGTITNQRYMEMKGTTSTAGGAGGSGTTSAGGSGGAGTTNIGEIRNGQYYDLKEIINQDIASYNAARTIEGDSILKILEDDNLSAGYYQFSVNGQKYPVHLYVYEGDTTWTTNMTFGDGNDISYNTTATQNTTSYRTNAQNMVIVKVKGNLTISTGVTVTTHKSNLGGPLGFVLYVTKTLTNNGIISQNSRGAYAPGKPVYLWHNTDDTYEYIPAAGAAGAGAVATGNGATGQAGSVVSKRALGGGGSGAATGNTGGAGAAGTSFSGGSGGGAENGNPGTSASNGAANGGTGGYGSTTSGSTFSGGGAGNPGGNGGKNSAANNASDLKGSDGTGGLLVIYSDGWKNNGTITSTGTTGGNTARGGGSSGGGSINIFTNEPTGVDRTGIITETRYQQIAGTMTAIGGGSVGTADGYKGGAGGAGTVNIGEIRNGQYYDLKAIINQDKTSLTTAQTVEGDSILSIIGSHDFTSGYYNFKVNGKNYPVHLYNFDGDQVWDSNKTFGDGNDISINVAASTNISAYRTYAQNMIVVKVNGNLTVNSGVTVTSYSSSYGGPKGLTLYVTGDLTNNGTITQTGKGAYAVGEDVYLYKNYDGTYEYVPAAGGAGATAPSSGNGTAGGNGTARRTGGGGAGAATGYTGGSGAAGTSYSGGSGGGAKNSNPGTNSTSGGANGGAGGYGSTSSTSTFAGGGAGNPGGNGGKNNAANNASDLKGENGTGGLLTIYATNYYNNGSVTAEGKRGGNAARGGGSSGGGSINVFYANDLTKGTASAAGGAVSGTTAGYYGGKGGNGVVTYTLIYLDPEFTSPTLSSLTVEGQTVTPTFDPKTYTYYVNLPADAYKVNVGATATSPESRLGAGIGEFDIPSGTSTHTVSVISAIGIVVNYNIEFNRAQSSYSYLSSLTIDGEEIEGFNPSKTTYNITVPYNTLEFEIDALYGRPDQTISGLGTVTTTSGLNTYIVAVTSEDGTSTTQYILNVTREHSSRLKKLYFDNFDIEPEFDPETLTYTLDVLSNTMSLTPRYETYDEEATVKTSGFGYIKTTGNGKITVSEPNSLQTVYTIRVVKTGSLENTSFDFNYTGGEQEFIAPYSGYYQLETWGAQGGYAYSTSYYGGYGAYATGATYLEKDEKVYINVGGQGIALSSKAAASRNGGYNGGGLAYIYYSSTIRSGSGGGATHIAKVSGTINNLGAYKGTYSSTTGAYNSPEILIVAAGGGGAGYYSSSNYGFGGHGGGIRGNNGGSRYSRYGTGATQTAGGYFTTTTSQGIGSFGLGGASASGSTKYRFGGAGGGGFYGGGASGNSYANGGGGGSSFIGSKNLLTFKSVTKAMYCYGCTTSLNEETYTVSTNSVSSTPTSKYTKTGNGYARITLMEQPSSNNFLSGITLKITNNDTGLTRTASYTPTFDIETYDYYLTVDTTDVKALISAKPEEASATIAGTGELPIPAGTTDYPIVVTAEDGTTRTYTIHITRAADDNPNPAEITVSGLVPSLCTYITNDDVDYCVLKKESEAGELVDATFDVNTHTYYLTVPSRIKQLWFEVNKGHPYQKVIGDGKFTVSSGTKTYIIEVESEDGVNHQIYTYVVTRDMTGDNDLSVLDIVEPDVNLNYEPDISEYYFSVDHKYNDYRVVEEYDETLDEDIIQIVVTTDDPNASFVTSGEVPFVNGMNRVAITVTAANGDVKSYGLNIYREKEENVYLSDIIIKSGANIYPLVPEFSKIDMGTYNVVVPNDITSIEIKATAESDLSSVSGDGTQALSVGDNTFSIIVTAENGTIETYVVNINRLKNGNPNLSSIKVDEGKYGIEDFDPDVLEYNIEVEEGTTTIKIVPTVEVLTTTFRLLDNEVIKVGNNDKRIIAIAENGTTKTYILHINRPAASDNTLKALTVTNGSTEFLMIPPFDPTVNEYQVVVDNNISKVVITGTKNNPLATVTGNGTYSLVVGDNVKTISVASESGDINEYTITIIRKPNADAYLKGISLSAGTLDPVFNKTTLEYTVTVNCNTSKIKINGIPNVTTTRVTGNDTYDIDYGENNFELVTLAEDGVTTLTYKVKVIREQSSNNYLSNLILKEGSIKPKFNKTTYEYSAVVPYSVDSATLNVTLDDTRSTYVITGAENLIVGDNEVLVTVTSQNGEPRIYKVNITRLDEISSRDTRLASLTVDTGLMVPPFNGDTMYYEVVVPYETKEITVKGVPEIEYSTVTGNGKYTLNVGDNLITLTVTSLEGTTRDYQILVTRKSNTDARLSKLVVSGITLSPSFDKDTYEYTLSSTESTLTFTTITPYDSDATYEIINNSLGETGTVTDVIVRVTAADGVTTKDYVLKTTKNKSTNNYLSSLEVEGYTYAPNFIKTTTKYDLIVENDINSVNISALPEESHATVSGTGLVNLVTGNNNVVISVTSEEGSVRNYTIVIKRKASNNTNLNNLIVNNGTVTESYSHSLNTYTVEVPYEESSLDLTVLLEDSNSTYNVVDNTLKVGANKVYVDITAEDGTVRRITLNVTRKEIVTALLKDIKVKDYNLEPVYNPYVNNYEVVINYEQTSLDLTIVKWDPLSTYVVTGNENFVVGKNTVTITSTSSDLVNTEVYTIEVTRQPEANTYLDYLYTDYGTGDLTPVFDKTILDYTFRVPYNVTTIELIGAPVDGSMTVTGLGDHSLNTGDNTINVVVQSPSGVKRTYKVVVFREYNSEKYLSTLTAKVGGENYSLNPEFDKDVYDYTINVDKEVTAINIGATTTVPGAIITGTGVHSLKPGTNEIKVTVTAEDGSTLIYTIMVLKEASSINNLIDLIPSVGTLEPEFAYEDTDYELKVDSGAIDLSFEVELEDTTATVVGTQSEVIPDGTSTREIVVTAEDGSTKTYRITVIKERTDNANLKDLRVIGYTITPVFDKDILEYNVTVSNSKTTLTSTDVVALLEDSNAKVTKTSVITLNTKTYTDFVVTVTAVDKVTTKEYIIHAIREEGSDSSLSNLSVNVGTLDKVFNPNVYTYEWTVPKGTILDENSVIAVAKDSLATIIKTNNLVVTSAGDNVYEVKVISENGLNSTTYTLNVVLDLAADATLSLLETDKGKWDEEFDPDTYEYNIDLYNDVTEVTVTATPNLDTAIVASGAGTVTLTSDDYTHEVVVQAEDGTTEIYKLIFHKKYKRIRGLNDLFFKDLDAENIECKTGECELTPTFDEDVISYQITVPFEYKYLNIGYELKDEEQSVRIRLGNLYLREFEIPVGVTQLYAEVYDGMGELTDSYAIELKKLESSNTYLKTLEVEGYELSPSFDKKSYEYTIEVASDVDEIDVTAIAEDFGARVSINGDRYLIEGDNEVLIEVLAADFETKSTYIIHVIKAPTYNSYLQNITVSTGIFWDLSPIFKKTTYDYTVTVTSSITYVVIDAVPVDPTAVVTGTGEFEISTGNNKFRLISTALDGTTSIYNINVVKEVSKNVNLKELKVAEAPLSPAFDRGVTRYQISVGGEVDHLTITAIPEDPSSSYIILGNNLMTGTNVVSVMVQNSDKSISKTYQIIVEKAPSTNKFLGDLKVYTEELNSEDETEKIYQTLIPTFDKETNKYKVELDSSVEAATIEAVTDNIAATLVGDGTYYLNYGTNVVNVSVTSEAGETNVYEIDLYRNYDLTLADLSSNIGTWDYEYNPEIKEYNITVQNGERSILINASPLVNNVSVTGDGLYNLPTGVTVVTVTVTAPDNKSDTYTLNINRLKSNNTNIDYIIVHEGSVREVTEDNYDYEVNVRNTVTKISVDVYLESPTSSYQILNNSFSGEGSHYVTIRVTAEDGSTHDYNIKVNVQPDSYFSNRLLKLTMTNGSFNPDFDPDTNYYAASVPNSITSTEIKAQLESIDATITGTGLKALNVGRNIFYIDVTSADGIVNTYVIVVYRIESSDATLSSMVIRDQDNRGLSFSPLFNSNVYDYTMTVDSSVENVDIIYTSTDPNSNVTINGPIKLTTGLNTYQVVVTAPDGITSKTYTIEITKPASNNNYASTLGINGYSITPTFDKTSNGPYRLSVDSSVNAVTVFATPEDSKSTVTGTGLYNLVNGINTIYVTVTSEDGTPRVYTLLVAKSMDSDSTLKRLVINQSKLVPDFDPTITSYDVEVDDVVSSIVVIGLANSVNATVSGNDTYALDVNPKVINITCTAQSGSSTVYVINVKKKTEASSKIKTLSVKEGQLTPEFNKNTTSYSVMVPNEITSLELEDSSGNPLFELEDPAATYEIRGNSNFAVGNNTVEIEVTASNGTQTTYSFVVARQTNSSNYLKSLSVVGFNITPAFDKTKLYYEVSVPSNTDQIQIKASKEDINSTLSGTGYKTLTNDVETFYVKVTSSSGSVRTYQVVVKKIQEEGNLLLTLSSDVGTLSPVFDSGTNTYTLTVPEGTKSVTLAGTYSNGAIASGLGKTNIIVGTQTRTITITSGAGVANVYTINIVRPAAKNTDLDVFTPSTGTLTPAFTNANDSYTLEVNGSTTIVSFTTKTNDANATVSGDGITTLSYGANTINITVTAEDTSVVRTITVTVTRMKDLISIVPNATKIDMSVGETANITYTFNPTDTSYTEVEWEVDNPTIISVDPNTGIVTAKEKGYANVTIKSKHNPSITARILVNVFDKKIMSSVYNIVRNDIPDGYSPYVIGCEPKTDITTFISNFDNNANTLHVYDSTDTEITDLSKFTGSYMLIKLIVNDVLYDTLTVIVRGDINGDGIVTVSDKTSTKNLILGKIEKTFYNVLIADLNYDGNVTVSDSTANKNFILGKTSSLN